MAVGRGVAVGGAVGVGDGRGVAVGGEVGVGEGRGVAVGSAALVASTRASTVASNEASASLVAAIPASTVACTSGVGTGGSVATVGSDVPPVQATAHITDMKSKQRPAILICRSSPPSGCVQCKCHYNSQSPHTPPTAPPPRSAPAPAPRRPGTSQGRRPAWPIRVAPT